jgi:hypothetical protein
MHKIFISYSRKDTDFVRKLAGDLETAGYDVWWDLTDLRGGDEWVTHIAAAIEASDFIIVVLSPNSIQSEWVRKEYTQAIGLHKRIIPLMFAASPVPFALNTINYVNFVSGEYQDNFVELLKALGYTDEPPVVTPFKRAQSTISGWMRYGIPAIILIVILLFVFLRPRPETPLPTPSPTTASTVTSTPEPLTTTASVTPSATLTLTVTVSATATATRPTSTPTVTIEVVESLPFCISRDIARRFTAIYVRTGPDDTYPPFDEGLLTKNPRTQNPQCLTFAAISEDGLWLLIANDQTDPEVVKFEGGWIRRDLLVAGVGGSVNLPVVTLTSTPTPSDTPTITPTFTRTPSPTLTPSSTPSVTPTATFTPTETETSTPTETPTP